MGKARFFKAYRLLGFGFLQAWIMLVASNPASMANNAFFATNSLAAGIFISGALCACVIGIVVMGAFLDIYSSSRILIAACVFAAGGTLLMLHESENEAFVLAGITLADFGTAYIGLRWGKLWSSIAYDRFALHLSVSGLFCIVLYAGIQALPFLVVSGVAAILPVLSGLILAHCADEPRRTMASVQAAIMPSVWRAVAVFLVIPAAYSLVRSFFAQGNLFSFGGNDFFVVLSFGLAAAVLLVFVSSASGRHSCVRLYRVALTYALGGCVAILSLPSAYNGLALGPLMLAYTLFDEIVFLLHPTLEIHVGSRVLSVFGWGRVVFRMAACLGMAVGALLLSYSGQSDSDVTTAIACTIMALLVVLLATSTLTVSDFSLFINPITTADVLRDNVQEDQRFRGDGEPKEERLDFEESCSAVAEEFGLSKREGEVLRFLARGRSLPFIEQQLFISNSTVRTHVRNIYRKLDVHTKQQLIDLVESTR